MVNFHSFDYICIQVCKSLLQFVNLFKIVKHSTDTLYIALHQYSYSNTITTFTDHDRTQMFTLYKHVL